jgi:hypothetical protein
VEEGNLPSNELEIDSLGCWAVLAHLLVGEERGVVRFVHNPVAMGPGDDLHTSVQRTRVVQRSPCDNT